MAAWIPTADVQAYLAAESLSGTDAALLAQTASDAVRAVLNRDIGLVTGTEYFDTNNTDFILLNHWPVTAIASVTFNGLAIDPAQPQKPGWRIDASNPRKLVLGQGRLPRGAIMAIAVSYTGGYDTTIAQGSAGCIPGTVHRALLLTAATIYYAQAADPNLTSESTGGVFSGGFQARGVGAVPQGARDLLANEIAVNP